MNRFTALFLTTVFALFSALSVLPALAAQNAAKRPAPSVGPHRGHVQRTPSHTIELFHAAPKFLKAYLLDANMDSLPTPGTRLSVLVSDKKASTTLSCRPMARLFVCKVPVDVVLSKGTRIIVQVTRDQRTESATFQFPLNPILPKPPSKKGK